MIHYETQSNIAEAFSVSRQSVSKWINSDGFPAKQKRGWNRDAVTAWVAAKNEREMKRAEAGGDGQEKTRLQCEKLRVSIKHEEEKLKQAKIDTKEKAGKLHDVADCMAERDRDGSVLRGAVDSWQAHNVAKMPDAKELIDGLCASFLAALEGVT